MDLALGKSCTVEAARVLREASSAMGALVLGLTEPEPPSPRHLPEHSIHTRHLTSYTWPRLLRCTMLSFHTWLIYSLYKLL